MSAVPIKPALIAMAALASAANAAPAPTAQPAPPSAAALKAAQFHLSVIMSALKADEVPDTIKAALFGCLYQHPLGDISDRTVKALAANKQLKADDPNVALMVMARICGAPAPAESNAKPAPKSNGAGR